MRDPVKRAAYMKAYRAEKANALRERQRAYKADPVVRARDRAARQAKRKADPLCRKAESEAYYSRNAERQKAAAKVWRGANAERKKIVDAAWRSANNDRAKGNSRAWYMANSDRMRATVKAWSEANPEKRREYARRWARRNLHKVVATTAKRRAQKILATPPWLTVAQRQEMADWYELAAATGLEVDHIVPLRGRNVRGLHVPWNLQLLTKSENCSKSNRHE